MVPFFLNQKSNAGTEKTEAADGVGGLPGKGGKNIVRNMAYGAGAMRVRPSKL